MQKFNGWWDMTHVAMLWELNAFGRTVYIKTGKNSMSFKMMLCFSLAMNLWMVFLAGFFLFLSLFLLLFFLSFYLFFMFGFFFVQSFPTFCVFFLNILFFFLSLFFSLTCQPFFYCEAVFCVQVCRVINTKSCTYCPPVHYAFPMICSSFRSPSNMTGMVVQTQFCLSL